MEKPDSAPHSDDSFSDEEKKELEKVAKEIKRGIRGVSVKISPRPFSPNGNPEERKAVKAREYRRWSNFINRFTMGGMPIITFPNGEEHDTTYDMHLVLEHTPILLQHLGVSDKPIGVDGETLQKILGLRPTKGNTWHKTDKNEVRNLQVELDNPLAVFAHEHEPDKIIVLTRMIDKLSEDNDNDIISLTLDKVTEHGVDAHIIATGYGQYKDKYPTWLREGLLIYANTKRKGQFAPWLKLPSKEELKKQGVRTEDDFPDVKIGGFESDPPIPEPDPNIRLFHDNNGAIVGTYNRKSNEVTLYPGANSDTVFHELCGHATWQYAEQQAAKGDKTLLNKMNEVVDSETAIPVWDEVAANYESDSHDVQREEVWAHIVGHKGSKAIERIRQTDEGKKWYHKAWGVVKDAWKGLLSAIGLNRIKTDGIERMLPEDFADYMVQEMLSGKTLGTLEKSDSESEDRKSIIGQKGANQLGIGGLKEAKKMDKTGKDRKTIWKETGWWKGKDGKWRVEIPDLKIKKGIDELLHPKRDLMAMINSQSGHGGSFNLADMDTWRLEDVIDDEALFKAYPKLKDVKVEFLARPSKENFYSWGSYDGEANKITLYRVDAKKRKDLERKLSHEVQHAIQKAEGLSFGTDSSDWESYRNSMGEVEARNVQKRFDTDRTKKAPWETEDVPEEKQVVGRSGRKAVGMDVNGMDAVQSLMAEEYPNVDAEEIINKLASLGSREEMEQEIRRLLEAEK